MKIKMKQNLLLSSAGKTIALVASLAILSGCESAYDTDTSTASMKTEMVASEMVLPATTTNDAARKLYMAGWADFENARAVSANASFKKAAKADPSFTMANVMAAWTANSTEGFVTNVGLAAANMDGASEGEQALVKMLQSFLANDAKAAIASAKSVTDIHPTSPRAWAFLGNAYANTNDTEDARAAFKKVIKLDSSYVPGHINLGNDYLTQEPKDFAKAETHFKHAIALTPNEPNPYDLLGDVHRAQNNLKAAYADYTKAAELAPELGSGLQQRGHVNSFLGNYDEARADYSKAADLEDARGSTFGPGFRVFGAYVSLHEGKPGAAISELQGIADRAASSTMEGSQDTRVNALLNIALIAIENGRNATASKAISDAGAALMKQADKLDSDDLRDGAKATKYYFKGLMAAKSGDADGASAAASAFKKQVASRTNPRKLERMHEVLGMSAYQQGDYAAAVEHLSKGNHVANMFTKYYLARANEKAGNADEAVKLYGEMAVYNFNGPGYAMFRKDIVKRAGG